MSGPAKKTKRRISRSRRRKNATRQKLLDAARAVFAERGLDLARIDEITERADVGKGTFYNHFGSKKKIIHETMRCMLSELVETVERRCHGITELPALLDALIGAHIEFFCTRWEDFVLYFQGRGDLILVDTYYPGIETPFDDYLASVERLVDGVIPARHSPAAMRRIACAVAGFVSGYYAFAIISPGDEDVDATFASLRQPMVASLVRFIREALPAPEDARSQCAGQ
jgi:AcrR family transcriptional regulator